jgi:hypothetical protein
MIACSQVSVGTAPTALCAVPPGPCAVTVTNAATAATVYLGTGSAPTTTTGAPVPAGQAVTVHGYPGSRGASLYAVAGATATVGVFISSGG